MDLQRQRLDRITASLLGGAVGDALGYAVEFQRLREYHELQSSCGAAADPGLPALLGHHLPGGRLPV